MKLPRILLIAGILLLTAQMGWSQWGQPTPRPRLGFGLGTPNTVLILRPGRLDFKIGYDFTGSDEYVFLSGDYRFINARHLSHFIHFSMGIGAYGKAFINQDDSMELESGFRLPLALSVFLIDNFLEFFVEVSPGLDFYPRLSFSDQPVQAWAGFTLELD